MGTGGGRAPLLVEGMYLQHAGAVRDFARRRVAAGDVDDVVARTFLVAWLRRDRLCNVSNPRSWLLAVARHVVADLRRSAARRNQLGQRVATRTDAYIRMYPDEVEAREVVRSVLATLRPDDRWLLTTFYLEDRTTAEIADILGCSPGAVSCRLHRVRCRLRDAQRP